jgi:sugar lactone lactonase YvrE
MNRPQSASSTSELRRRSIITVARLLLLLALSTFCGHVRAALLFVSDENSGTLDKITPSGVVSNFASGIFSGGGGPFDLAFQKNGNLLEANGLSTNPGTIFRFTPAGVRSVFFSATSFVPVSLAFDSSGRLFVGDTIFNNISIITTTGSKVLFASGVVPERLAFDKNGNLFVADISGVIYKYTPSGAQTIFANASNNRSGLAFDSQGNLFASNYLGGEIDEYTPSGVRTTFATGLNFPDGLAFDSSGNLYEADAGSGNIFKFSPNGVRTTFASGLQGPTFLAFAVPEPSSRILLAVGGLALGAAAIGGGLRSQKCKNRETRRAINQV